MTTTIRKSRSLHEIAHYTAISGVALILHYSTCWLLISKGLLSVGAAAATGCSIGLVFAYLAMSEHLFRDGWLSGHRAREVALLALSGLIGIILSCAITESYITFVRTDVHHTKLSAALILIIVVYAFRKLVVFRRAWSRKPCA